MILTKGIIKLDTAFAVSIGFTSDGFRDYSYLWGSEEEPNTIIPSMIASKTKGAFRTMMHLIEQQGLFFQIPTPSRRMRDIGRKQGWKHIKVMDEKLGIVDVLTNRKEVR